MKQSKNSDLQDQGEWAKPPLCPTSSAAPRRSQAWTQNLLGGPRSRPKRSALRHCSWSSLTTANSDSQKILKLRKNAIETWISFPLVCYHCPRSDRQSRPSEGRKDQVFHVKWILSPCCVSDSLLGMGTAQGTKPGLEIWVCNYCHHGLGEVISPA